jgi:hypothetical protein
MRSGRTSKSKGYVTISIITSKNLRFRRPQHIVVVDTICFCLTTAIFTESELSRKILDFRQKSNMALASVTAPFWCLPDYVFLKKT